MDRLDALGLPVGPWLRELKTAVLNNLPDETPFPVWWREEGRRCERTVPFKILREKVVQLVPGLKVGYVVDAVYHDANARRIIELVKGADILFIEAPFLDADRALAARRFHLTAQQAGELGRRAMVKRLVPFHFSPRYQGRAEELKDEAQRAFTA